MAWSPPRNVLQEIPPSLFVSRSSATLTSRVDSQSNMVLIPQSFLTPSPEEQIIRQRSRRTSLTTLHPQVLFFDDIENEETPSKFGLPLNTHTRKRLLLTPPKDSSSPIKDAKVSRAKKPRLHRKLAGIPLHTELQAYSTEQLVDLLDKLVTSRPELEQEVRKMMSSPDLRPLEERLKRLHRNILSALPTTRWSSSRDTFCYRRVKVHLDMFKRSCLEQGRVLLKAQCWEATLRYVIQAWRVVNQLPNWDEPAQNDHKQKCFQVLAAQCMLALKKSKLEKDVYRDFKPKLKTCQLLNKEMAPCVHFLDSLLDTVH